MSRKAVPVSKLFRIPRSVPLCLVSEILIPGPPTWVGTTSAMGTSGWPIPFISPLTYLLLKGEWYIWYPLAEYTLKAQKKGAGRTMSPGTPSVPPGTQILGLEFQAS